MRNPPKAYIAGSSCEIESIEKGLLRSERDKSTHKYGRRRDVTPALFPPTVRLVANHQLNVFIEAFHTCTKCLCLCTRSLCYRG